MLLNDVAVADPRHGIAMHGEPALSADFTHLPYANPNAPQGGEAVFAEAGTFDSLNPYVLRGNAPWPIRVHMVESLMARSYDEPFTLYGLLAESIDVSDDRREVSFVLRPEARFSDGSPVTVEDVVWSIGTLGTEGHPRYRNSWAAVESIEVTGPRRVTLRFNTANRELPLIFGLRPILKKAQFEGRTFGSAPDEPIIGSGPYLLDHVEPGQAIVFRKNPDWWGRDLPVNRGLNNFDRIRYVYYRDSAAVWEAVRSGAVSLFADYDPVRWADEYGFPAILEGRLHRASFAHARPSGMRGFVFNTRREIFSDRRVREALALSFNWEWINDRVYRGQFQRIRSYFSNSALGFSGAASQAERALLAPFADRLPPETIEHGWTPPPGAVDGRNRRALREASALLDSAGYPVVDGVRRGRDGAPLSFDILLESAEDETLASLWRQTLERLGIAADLRLVDKAQYNLRREAYDYDVIVNFWAMSLSPGTEQRLYFGGYGRETPGTRNYMGVADPAVDGLIDALLAAEDPDAFRAAVQALDRVLTAGIYVIPFGTLTEDRIVWQDGFARPEATPLYGWWGWWAGPAVWWRNPKSD